MILESRSHLDLGDLPNLHAAELGVMTVRIERAIRSLDGVERVHVNRWGDGAAHFHQWFLGRPTGYLQLRGSFLSQWDDILEPIPEARWRENLAHVAAWLADFGGRAIAEPPRIEWHTPSRFGDVDVAAADESIAASTAALEGQSAESTGDAASAASQAATAPNLAATASDLAATASDLAANTRDSAAAPSAGAATEQHTAAANAAGGNETPASTPGAGHPNTGHPSTTVHPNTSVHPNGAGPTPSMNQASANTEAAGADSTSTNQCRRQQSRNRRSRRGRRSERFVRRR